MCALYMNLRAKESSSSELQVAQQMPNSHSYRPNSTLRSNTVGSM